MQDTHTHPHTSTYVHRYTTHTHTHTPTNIGIQPCIHRPHPHNALARARARVRAHTRICWGPCMRKGLCARTPANRRRRRRSWAPSNTHTHSCVRACVRGLVSSLACVFVCACANVSRRASLRVCADVRAHGVCMCARAHARTHAHLAVIIGAAAVLKVARIVRRVLGLLRLRLCLRRPSPTLNTQMQSVVHGKSAQARHTPCDRASCERRLERY